MSKLWRSSNPHVSILLTSDALLISDTRYGSFGQITSQAALREIRDSLTTVIDSLTTGETGTDKEST